MPSCTAPASWMCNTGRSCSASARLMRWSIPCRRPSSRYAERSSSGSSSPKPSLRWRSRTAARTCATLVSCSRPTPSRRCGAVRQDREGIVMTQARKTASYGSWKSPITSELIVAQSIALSDVRLDNGRVYWLDGRPQEQGRPGVVREGPDGQAADITPKPFNARTRVHEYGGGAWLADNGTVYFSHFADGRLYRQAEGEEPQPLTPRPANPARGWRYADGAIDHGWERWIGVREDHTGEGEAVNAIVAVRFAKPEAGKALVDGHDFFASPRLSPDG